MQVNNFILKSASFAVNSEIQCYPREYVVELMGDL